MIVQCEQCQTRFRLADEKLREGGIKVRCSKCKHIFLVEPPASETAPPPAPEPQFSPPTEPEFSTPGETVEEVPAAASQPPEDRDEEIDFGGFNMEPVPAEEAEQVDSNATRDADDPSEITFPEEDEMEETEAPGMEDTGELSFQVEEDEESPAAADSGTESEEEDEMFSFDEPSTESAGDLDFSDAAGDEEKFSWDEEIPAPPPEEYEFEKPTTSAVEEDLGFGEIALPGREAGSGGGEAPSTDLAPDIPGSGGSEDTWHQAPPSPRPEPMAAPPASKERGKGKGLQIFVLFLLLIVGGAIGYLYWQEGTVDLDAAQRVIARLTGQAQPTAFEQKIEVGNLKGFFVTNRQEGQLFIISGRAVNKFGEERSAIQVKGLIFDKKGKVVQHQTAFAGNPLDEGSLRSWPFAKISESMNNQFGDSLSNLNLGPGKSINFTVVFKALPAEMAEFSVEVVDSQPGSK